MVLDEWKKGLSVLWSVQFIGMSAITGVISFLPLYVAQLGITEASEAAMWSGILVGSAAFCAAISNPYWGAMADRKGRQLMVERVLFLFALIIFAMAFVSNVYQLLFLRILQGLCGGFVAASTALAVSMIPKEKIAATVGMLQTSLIVGGAMGPMLGGFIADRFGYRQPFIVFGILCIVALGVTHWAITEKHSPVPAVDKPSLKATFASVWSVSDLRLMLLVQFLTQFAIHSIGPILPLFIQTILSTPNNLAIISGSIIAIVGVTSAIASASMGFLCKHFSHKQILITASLLGGITFIGQLAAQDIIMLAVLRGINGLCIGAMVPSSNTIIAFLIPESKRGAAFGMTNGVALMGNVIGPVSAGLLSLVFGITAIFWLTSILFFLVSLLLFSKLEGRMEARP